MVLVKQAVPKSLSNPWMGEGDDDDHTGMMITQG